MSLHLKFSGKIEGLYTTPNPDEFITEYREQLEFLPDGIPGDRHSGFTRLSGGREKKQYPKGTLIRNNRQWSALSMEELAMIARSMQLEDINPGWLGANLLVSGIPGWSGLPSMALIKIFHGASEGPVLVNYGQNKPCIHPHRAMEVALGKNIDAPFTKAATETRGLVGWVEKAGVAHIGDQVEVWMHS